LARLEIQKFNHRVKPEIIINLTRSHQGTIWTTKIRIRCTFYIRFS